MRHRWWIASSLAAWFAVATARADDRALDEGLTIATDDDCLGRAPLLEAVRTWLGRDSLDAQIEILIESNAGRGSVVVLRSGVVHATRRFDRLPASCADRRAVLALAVAIAIDAALLETLSTPPPAVVSEVAGAPREAPEPAAQSAPWVVELGARGGVAIGLLRDPSALVGLDVGVLIARTLSITLGGEISSPVSRALAGGSVRSMLAAGHLRACAVRPDPALELSGCLLVFAGAVLADGAGYARSFSTAQPWVAAAAELELSWWIDPHVGLHLAAQARVPFVSTRFDVLDGAGAVLASEVSDPVAATLSGGIRVRIDSP